MPFKVQVGPPQIAIHQGQTVLISDPDGQVSWSGDRGLYFLDTRVISAWSMYANGEEWELLNGGPVTYHAARIYLTNRAFLTEDGPVPARTVSLVLSRAISGGMHEDLDIRNHGTKPIRFQFEISVRSDFADIFEVKSNRIVRRGHIATDWSPDRQALSTIYTNRDFRRGVIMRAEPEHGRAAYANGRLSFEVALAPGEAWHSCLFYHLTDGNRSFDPPEDCVVSLGASPHEDEMQDWQSAVLKMTCSNEEFYRLFRQAIDDMAALRLPITGTDHMVFLPAAGLPWFVAPFGRDSLIVSLQNILIYPEFARASLQVMGDLQATEDDPKRDAEPGKIPHELRYGELAHFKLIPHTPYYGTADATPLYLITLHAAWSATGDHDLLERHLPNAEAALRWIDESGDRDGDGFQEYQTRSPSGYENMGWKDAGDALVYPDGTLVRGPKALCELQGYVYDAWLRMADIFGALGKPDRASELRARAAKLFERFNEAFWDDEFGCYAYALDGEKKKVLSLASNPGHCLWSGIVPPDRARRVMQRLTAPDMWSGWGIRTLSAQHAAYNPYSYQCGSVWPHDNAIIAMGFKRYGFAAEANRIARDISEAGSHFLLNQLPELYAGIQRQKDGFPVQYIGANVPQAWAAGSAFMLLQTILGVVPDAPRDKLFIDPVLPDWLPDVTLRGLRMGAHRFDIRFAREGDATEYLVIAGDGSKVVRRPMGESLGDARANT
jgi:glycogen debranching enzyme